MVRAAARGGNLLMNVGPMGNGEIDPVDVEILEGIGDWLIPNGESIYGVERTPLAVQGWGDTTVKGNRLYLHVMDWPDSGELVVGGLETKVNKARFLTANNAASLDFRRLNELDIAISIPDKSPDTLSTVVVLELDGPPVADKTILLDPAVSSNMLHVFEGELHGKDLKWGGGNIRSNFIQSWPSPEDYISWPVRSNESGRYKVTARYTGIRQSIGNTYTVELAGQSLEGTVKTSGKHLVIELGEVIVPKGRHTLIVKAKNLKPGTDLVNLTDISFIPVK